MSSAWTNLLQKKLKLNQPFIWFPMIIVLVALSVGIYLYLDEGPVSLEDRQTLKVTLPTFGAEVLDPSLDSQTGFRYHGHMYDHLLGAQANGRPSTQLGALNTWDASGDASQYTLTLKKNMQWHNGTEVTSEDIRFSMDHYSRVSAACASCGYIAENIKGVDLVDRYTAKIELVVPDFAFMNRLGPEVEDVPLLPMQYWNSVGSDHFRENPVGSGPWRFSERILGESIKYESNVDYWNSDRIPHFERLRIVQVPDSVTRVAMLKSNTTDMAPISVDQVESVKSQGFTIDGPRNIVETTLRFFMSYDSSFLTANQNFRQALVLGTDLRNIVDSLYPPEAATLSSGSAMFGPLADGYDPNLQPYGYDREQAINLLSKSGYQGETVHLMSIAAYGLTQIPKINEMIADDWRNIGINVSIVPAEYTTIKARYVPRPQHFDDMFPAPIFHGGHIPWPGGIMNSVERYLTSSIHSVLSYHDPALGDKIFQELKDLTNPDDRTKRLKELNQELYHQYWAAPVIWRHDTWALQPHLYSWQPTDGTYSDLHLETIQYNNK